MKVLEYIIRALDKTADGNKSAKEGAKGTSRSILSDLANIKAGWDMATGAIGAGAKAVWSAVKEAFKFETLTIQFSVLMGSMSKAKERMKEMADFAASTPFSMEEVVTASRQLYVFSDGALGASNSLRLVGDAAAAVGQNIQEVSFWVGRAYSMIKGGQPFGEAAMRLQEMGIITPEVRTKMEDLQAAGAANIKVWEVLSDRLLQFKGGMAQLSQTGDGLVSTLKDTWTESIRTFGQSFMEVSKTAIGGLIEWLGKLNSDGTIKEWAEKTLEVLYQVAGAAKAVSSGGGMRAEAWEAVTDVIVGGLELGAVTLGDAIKSAIKNGADYAGEKINAALRGEKTVVGKALGTTALLGAGIKGAASGWFGDVFSVNPLSAPLKAWNRAKSAMMDRQSEAWSTEYVEPSQGSGEARSRLDRKLSTLKALGASFRADVTAKTADLKNAADSSTTAAAPAKAAAEKKRIIDDMAKAQALVDEKRAKETAKVEAEERRKLAEKNADEEHAKRVAHIREEAQVSAQSEATARDRLSRANSAAQQAWGWYRDPESFKRQLAEEKANAAAEKQYAKDFDKLNDRSDWRTTKRLTDSEESVRRVALAREEQDRAQQALLAIEKNTAGLESMLKRLLTSK